MLIRLRGCAGCSAPLLFAYGIYRFLHDVAQLTIAANTQPQQNRVCIFISYVIFLRPKDPLFQKLFTLGGFSYSDYTRPTYDFNIGSSFSEYTSYSSSLEQSSSAVWSAYKSTRT